MTHQELVEAMAKDLCEKVWGDGTWEKSETKDDYRIEARAILATHAPAIIRLAVEGYMAGTGKPNTGATLYLTEELLADGLVRAWQRGEKA